jgi:propionate CoA-transferase
MQCPSAAGDTVACSGFVSQGAPEALLEGLGNRFRETGTPRDLTVLFGGGPGDWATKGLNHLGQEGMIRRAIGSHYGQTPMIAELVLANKIEGYAFPMGAISRMFQQVSRH